MILSTDPRIALWIITGRLLSSSLSPLRRGKEREGERGRERGRGERQGRQTDKETIKRAS